jgi:hypothetical protein
LRCSFFVIFFSLDGFITESDVSLLNEGESDTFSLWNGDSWGLAVTNNNDVLESGGEMSSLGVLDMSDFIGSWMLLDGLEVSNSADVVSSDEHNGGSWLELNDTADGFGTEIVL